MAKNTSISLGEHFDEFITKQLKSGRYGSTSEVIRAGLRILEETDAKREYLRQCLIEGEHSGIADYSYQSLMEELDNEVR